MVSCLGGGGGGRGGGGGAGGDTPPAADAGAGAAGGRQGGGGGAGGGRGGGGRGGGQGAAQRDPADFRGPFVDYPEEFTKRRGTITAATVAKIQEFVKNGGTLIAVDAATGPAIQAFSIPLVNHVTASGADYFVPGSVLRVAVDPKNPLAHGYGDHADVFFDNSPVWKLGPGASAMNLRSVAWFDTPEPLRSGWAWGQRFLDKGIQIVETNVGTGRVFLFGNDLLFRSQPHGSYKFFFNALYLSVAPDMKAGAGQ
jgi:hypothetical protein